MRLSRFRATGVLVWFGACLLLDDTAADPLRGHDDGPLTGLYGFPDATESSRITARGQQRIAVYASSASHNIGESAGAESLTLDGETTRIALQFAFGAGERLDVGIEVPYVWHHSGNLDDMIDGWHDLFGLPEGPRATREQDVLDMVYTDARREVIRLEGNAHGVGDLRLTAGWRLGTHPAHRTALRFGLKLPTGDSSQLLGSGGFDLSAGFAGDLDAIGAAGRASAFYRFDLVYLGAPDVLAERANDVVGQASGGFGYRVTPGIDLRLQARVRSAVHDSAIESLGGVSATLTAGADILLTDHLGLTLAFGEDLKPDSAPDISFQLAFRYR